MKVVLFCGGLGTRLREYSETIPKPMVTIGYRPIIWHVMKYYAHFGHTDFILCLGYRGDVIKQYFLNYEECLSNDFVLSKGGKEVTLHSRDIEDWNITFVDTGLDAEYRTASQGGAAVARRARTCSSPTTRMGCRIYPSPTTSTTSASHDAVASFVSVRPNQTFHIVSIGSGSIVSDIRHVADADLWINGGFFAFKQRDL